MDTTFEFDGLLTPSCIQILITSFLNFVLYQRRQIPFPFDSFENYIKSIDAALSAESSTSGAATNGLDVRDVRSHQQQLREQMKLTREAQKKARNAAKLKKKMQSFLALHGTYRKHLSDVLDTGSWEDGVQVALLLGGTPVSPRETYLLEFAPTRALYEGDPARLQPRRGIRQLFRTLVTSSSLLEVTSRPLSPTNIYVLVRTRPRPPLLARPDQTFRRGTLLRLRLTSSASVTSQPAVPSGHGVRACCGRGAPRRLQSCCAAVAAEMGLSLLDTSASPPPAGSGLPAHASPLTLSSGSMTSSSQTSVTSLSVATGRSGASDADGADCGEFGWPRSRSEGRGDAERLESDTDEEEDCEPPSQPLWCQLPVVLRGSEHPVLMHAPQSGLRTTNKLAVEVPQRKLAVQI